MPNFLVDLLIDKQKVVFAFPVLSASHFYHLFLFLLRFFLSFIVLFLE